MGYPFTVVVASDYKPLITLLERAMRGEASVRQVAPNAEEVLKSVTDNPNALVVLHERKGDENWLRLAKALRDANPSTRVVAFGESGDVGVVARGMVHGVANYVRWNFGASPLEIHEVITDAVAGEGPPKDTIYARVRSMLPSNSQGGCVLASGKALLTDDAIEQCLTIGLTAEETASHLGVSKDQVERIVRQARRKPRVRTALGTGRLKVLVGLLLAGLALFVVLNRKREKVFVPVSGTLTVSGKPLRDVIVHFSREGGSHLASGKTDATGKYRLSTLRQGDGAEEGVHVVWVGVPSKIRDHIEMTDPKYTEKMVALMEKLQAEKESKPKNDDQIVPAPYRDMRSSPLRAEVRGKEPIVVNLDLKR